MPRGKGEGIERGGKHIKRFAKLVGENIVNNKLLFEMITIWQAVQDSGKKNAHLSYNGRYRNKARYKSYVCVFDIVHTWLFLESSQLPGGCLSLSGGGQAPCERLEQCSGRPVAHLNCKGERRERGERERGEEREREREGGGERKGGREGGREGERQRHKYREKRGKKNNRVKVETDNHNNSCTQ